MRLLLPVLILCAATANAASPQAMYGESCASGAVVISGVVAGAEDARQAWLAVRRIAGIKTLDNRLVSGELLAWD